jgi:hypothetical protein
MKKIYSLLIVLAMPFFLINVAKAQCTPDTTCIDTGDPGQMCPDSLVDGTVNEPYTEVITVWPPQTATVGGFPITLSHIKIVSVANLPTGLSYQSNAANDLLATGSYYCILIDGTPTTEGVYPLKIEVMPYIMGFPTGTTIIDSTSLFIEILPEVNSVATAMQQKFNVKAFYPNPFEDIGSVFFSIPQAGEVHLSIVDGLGREIFRNLKDFPGGENSFQVNAPNILPGIYYYSLSYLDQSVKGIIMKQ